MQSTIYNEVKPYIYIERPDSSGKFSSQGGDSPYILTGAGRVSNFGNFRYFGVVYFRESQLIDWSLKFWITRYWIVSLFPLFDLFHWYLGDLWFCSQIFWGLLNFNLRYFGDTRQIPEPLSTILGRTPPGILIFPKNGEKGPKVGKMGFLDFCAS